MVFLWALASLLSGLYLLSLRSFPFDSYLSELTVAALVFAVVGNLLLGFWLSQLKGRYVAQGKAIVMKQNLLAIAAHELRTPLLSIPIESGQCGHLAREAAHTDHKSPISSGSGIGLYRWGRSWGCQGYPANES